MTSQQPAYPFFARYGEGHFTAYLSNKVMVAVNTPGEYWPRAEIRWDRATSEFDVPCFAKDGREREALVSPEEFMAAYHAAEAFIQAAERDLLPAKPVEYMTSAQKAEVERLLNHPAFGRPVKTKMRLKMPSMTYDEAKAAISALSDTRTMFDGLDRPVGQYAVKGEAYEVKAA